MNERLLNAGLLAVSLGVAIATGEIVVRKYGRVQMQPTQFALDSFTVYRLKPGVRGHAVYPGVMEYRWTTNRQQLRAPREYSVAKPTGTKRVVVIGDSFTFGIGVNDGETYSAQLERRLRTDCPEPVEVLNFGVGGYGLSQGVETFERYARPFSPDVVIYGFMTNDVADNIQAQLHVLVGDSAVPRPVAQRPQMIAAKRITEMIPGYSWLITHSALVNGARQMYFVLKRRRETGGVDPAADAEAWWKQQQKPDTALWNLQRALLVRMRDRVTASGAKYLVAILSEQRSAGFYVAGHPEQAAVQHEMRRLCTELALRCVDVDEWLARSAPTARLDTLFIQGDGHYTPAGQSLAAGAIEPAVREMLGCTVDAAATRHSSALPPALRKSALVARKAQA